MTFVILILVVATDVNVTTKKDHRMSHKFNVATSKARKNRKSSFFIKTNIDNVGSCQVVG